MFSSSILSLVVLLSLSSKVGESQDAWRGFTSTNIVEQDHRFIKRRVKPGLGFFSPETAWNTLQGYEVMNMVRKGQMRGVEQGNIVGQIAFIPSLFGVAA
jgi:transposase-like protein